MINRRRKPFLALWYFLGLWLCLWGANASAQACADNKPVRLADLVRGVARRAVYRERAHCPELDALVLAVHQHEEHQHDDHAGRRERRHERAERRYDRERITVEGLDAVRRHGI